MQLKYYYPDAPIPNFFVQYLQANGIYSVPPQEANYFVLPFMYEIVYDYSEMELSRKGITKQDVAEMKKLATELNELSVTYNKRLIVFFYRDPDIDLPFENALVFRTSYRAGLKRPHIFGLPAFVDNFATTPERGWLTKMAIPTIFFAGKAAPQTLSLGMWLRNAINNLFEIIGLHFRIKNWSPEGYFLRRRAMLSCIRAGKRINSNFFWNPAPKQEGYAQIFVKSLQDTPYCICAAGFGNYSFRLYEVLKAGRIPVYIDTDELLPCRDVLPWKDMMIWVPALKVDSTAQYLLKYHQRVSAADFIQRQKDNAALYDKYLTRLGFSKYLHDDFLPNYLIESA